MNKTPMGGAVQVAPLALGNTVSTVAGVARTAGFANYSSPAGPPALFNRPTDITTDGTSYYVADYLNNVIRKITASGEVTTLQCTSDGIIPSGFNRPFSLTTDGVNLYVVDSGSNTIRFIDLATKIVTIIGSTSGVSGSIDSTVPADVRFKNPTGITTDGENLYIADSGNHTIRRVVIATKAVSTMAGAPGEIGQNDGIQSAARFSLPARITTDRTALYVTDFNNRLIRKIDILTGAVTTLAGTSGLLGPDEGTLDGTGPAARFHQPNGITTDGSFLYVTDSYKNTIRKIDKSSGVVTTLSGRAGTAGATDSPDVPTFDTPIGIIADGTGLLVTDSGNNTIRRIR